MRKFEKILVFGNIILIILIAFLVLKPENTSVKSLKTNPEVEKIAKNLVKLCENSLIKESCYGEEFEKIVKDKDFDFAKDTLFSMQDLDPVTKSCHTLAHYIGRYAVEKNPEGWSGLFDRVDVNACGSGFLHGVLEAHLEENHLEISGKMSDDICLNGEDEMRKRMCTHLMGHIFIVHTEDNVEKSASICNTVNEKYKFDCFNGLFMEHNQKIALADHGITELPQYTPEYAKKQAGVCVKYKGPAGSACATEMAEVYAKTFGYEAETLYNKCKEGLLEDAYKNCYSKAVTVLSTYPYERTTKQLTDICKYYETESEYKGCVNNLLESLLSYSPKFTDRGLAFCENIENHGDFCLLTLGKKLEHKIQNPEERVFYCKNAKNIKNRKICSQTN